MSEPPPDMWDALAESVPEARRELYWRTIARLRQLRPDDEVLLLIEAMGILATITAETPKRLAAERAEWKTQMAQIRMELKQLVQETISYTTTAGNAIDRATASLNKTASYVQASAETVRNGLREAPSRVDAVLISSQVARHLEAQLVKPAEKAVQTMTETVGQLPGFVQHAEKTMQFLKDFNISWHYINAVITAIALALVFTFLFK